MTEGISPDRERQLRASGLNPDENYRITDLGSLDEWKGEHPEWATFINSATFSYESSIIADTFGAPTPDHWADFTIEGDTDGWAVHITDDDGNTYNIPMFDAYDLAWDFYDVAGFYDVDRDKDIDTGGTET